MKKLNKVIAIAAMLGLWSGTGYAQGLIYINVNGTASVQNSPTTVGDVTKTPPPSKFKITSAELLSSIATTHATNYDKGARLAINTTNSDAIVVADKAGNIIDSAPE